MNRLFNHFLTLLLLFCCISVTAQQNQFNFKKFSRNEGLSSGRVYSIIQDRQGFIWIGTDNGLNRFDGYSFTNYYFKDSSRQIYNSFNTNSLIEDRETGNFWIASSIGLLMFDINAYKYINNFVETGSLLRKLNAMAVCQDQHGNIVVGGINGLYVFDPTSKKVTSISVGLKKSFTVNKLMLDKSNNLWVGTDIGLALLDIQKQKCIFYPLSLKDSLVNIVSIYEDSKKNLWFCTNRDGVYKMQGGKGGKIIHYSNKDGFLPGNRVVSVAEDYRGNMFFAVRDVALVFIDSKTNKKYLYTPDKYNPDGISSAAITCLFKDRIGNLWIGSWSSGINFIDRNRKPFFHYKNNFLDSGLISNNVRCFFQDSDGDIWIGTREDGGLSKFNKDKGTFVNYQHKRGDQTSIGDNYILSITEPERGKLLLATWRAGIDLFDKKTGKFRHFRADAANPQGLPDNDINLVHADSKGQVWTSLGNKSLGLFNYKNGKFVPKEVVRARSIYEDNEGVIWIGTTTGLAYYDRSKEKLIRLNQTISNVPFPYTTSVNIDSKKNIWIGTNGLGLYCIQKKSREVKNFSEDDGLSGNIICNIQIDAHDNLWISTTKGITKFNPTTGKFRNYDRHDGLQGAEFERYAGLRLNSGEMLFGGGNGFNIFHPDSIRDNTTVPHVVFTDFKIYNKSVVVDADNSPLKKHITQTDTVILNYNHGMVTFEFVAINYSTPEKNKYAYKLEGVETDWNYIGTQRSATYTMLPPGEYKLRIIASNNDEVWNVEGKSLTLIVLPPWWKTWWFYTILWLCLIGTLVYATYRVILKIKQLAHQTILDERNQLKTLINNIPDDITIKDQQSRFLIMNKQALNKIGDLHENDIIGKSDFDIYPKEIADAFYIEEQEILASGVPMINKESVRKGKNGEDIYLLTTKCPIISNYGAKILGLIVIVKDITQRKIAARELEKQSEELKIYNNVLSETNVLLEERQQQIEEQAEELRTRSENLKEVNELLIDKQRLIQVQTEKLEEINKQLSELNSAKDKLFSIIAHDLRNPFHAVMGFSEILLRSYQKLPLEKVEKYLDMIYTSSKSGNNLLDNLLQWSRAQSGYISFDPVNLNLALIVEDSVKLLEWDALRKNIAMISSVGSDICVVADENMLKTILRNLLANAIKFTRNNGQISVETEVSNDTVIIIVEDNGIGISEEIQTRLFNVKTNISTKGTSEETGTGLGLILCKEFVERNKGKIWIESEPDKGSRFKFTLPLC